MLFVAAFTELLQFPFISRAGWKLKYPALGIFQDLNICFKTKLALPLESRLFIQWLKFSFLTISFWYFAASSWIALVSSGRWHLFLSLHKAFQLVHNAALLLNSYDALRRFSQGDQFIKRNESMEHLSYTEKCGLHQNYLFVKLTRLTWPETKYLHTDFPERKWKHFYKV